MKKLLVSILLLIATALPIMADNTVVVCAANTASNLVATPLITDSMTFTATSASTTTVKLYDSATTGTNIVLGAYTRYITYTTNYSTVWTNENSMLVTNTFVGTYTAPVSAAKATSSLPALLTVVIPGSGQRTKTIQLQAVRGLTAVPDQNVIIEVDYRKNP